MDMLRLFLVLVFICFYLFICLCDY